MSKMICTVFGLGYLRPAPGTWASLVAVLVAWGIDRAFGFPVLALATVAVTVLGFWAVGRELSGKTGEDPSEFVIDEVAGQWLALLASSAAFWVHGGGMPWPAPLAAFVFFRLFDIWKPWLVGRADRRHDAAGVMIDDLWAGVFAAVASIVAAGLYHGIMVL
jgi:phosphatidylglycerophosphatase A